MNIQAVAEARTLVEQGLSANKAAQQVAAKHGVGATTVKRWAKQDGTPLGIVAQASAANARACARAERLRLIEEGLARTAEAFSVLAGRLVMVDDGKQAQGFAWAAKACFEMLRLAEGEATSRVEHLSKDEFMAEVERLTAQVDAGTV
jgi:hypothetical protein